MDDTMQAIPQLLALATAVPPYRLSQADVVPEAARLFAGVLDNAKQFAAIYANTEIDTRYSCVPLEWYGSAHSFTERNNLYVEMRLHSSNRPRRRAWTKRELMRRPSMA